MSHRQLNLETPPTPWPLTWPMGLTMLRLLLLPVFLWVMLRDAHADEHPNRWWAIGIFVVMAITDKLDGYLARRLNQTSKLGAILDPVADKLLITCSVILLSFDWVAAPGYAIPLWVAASIYGKDVIVVIGVLIILSVLGKVNITARWLGKLATFTQLMLVLFTLIAPDLARLSPDAMPRIFQILWALTAGLSVAACVDYFIQGVRAGYDRPSLPPAV